MRMFNISASVGCHKGNKRKNNEDNFYLNGEFKEDPNEKKNLFFNINTNDKIQVYAVCDGMGGGDLGEIASYIAVKILSKYQKEVFNYSGRITIEKHIDEYIEDVNERICEVASKLNKDCIGTTLALIIIYEDYMYIYNLGDSRIYFISKYEIIQLSKDHTKAQMLYKSGIISKDEMKSSPSKNILTQYLGISTQNGNISPYKIQFRINKGDRFLICSDGVSDLLNDNEIENIIRNSSTTDNAVSFIVDNSLLKGGIDNITALLIEIEGSKNEKANKVIRCILLLTFLVITIIGINLLY